MLKPPSLALRRNIKLSLPETTCMGANKRLPQVMIIACCPCVQPCVYMELCIYGAKELYIKRVPLNPPLPPILICASAPAIHVIMLMLVIYMHAVFTRDICEIVLNHLSYVQYGLYTAAYIKGSR